MAVITARGSKLCLHGPVLPVFFELQGRPCHLRIAQLLLCKIEWWHHWKSAFWADYRWLCFVLCWPSFALYDLNSIGQTWMNLSDAVGGGQGHFLGPKQENVTEAGVRGCNPLSRSLYVGYFSTCWGVINCTIHWWDNLLPNLWLWALYGPKMPIVQTEML